MQELYLALLADARRDTARPSPGKVTRTMRLQAHQAGKRRRPHISHLTGQPIAPGKRTLASYIEPAEHRRRAQEEVREPLELDAAAVRASMLGDPKDAWASTRGFDDPALPGKASSGATPPSAQDILEPGTIAYRRFQANLAAALGHFEQFEALEAEGISPEPVTVMGASPTGADGVDFVDAEVNGWPLSTELQVPLDWEVREWRADAWTVQLDDNWPETFPEHIWSPAGGRPYQTQLADEEETLLPPMIAPGRTVENWGVAGPIQAAGLQELPELPVRLPHHGGGTEMPEEVRAEMEAAFGVDFSQVRIHEGTHVEAVGALAYTQGTDIHFVPGQYQPTSWRGQELLAHELMHVVQQSQGRVQATMQASGVSINDDASLEREADEMGVRTARGAEGGKRQSAPSQMRLNDPIHGFGIAARDGTVLEHAQPTSELDSSSRLNNGQPIEIPTFNSTYPQSFAPAEPPLPLADAGAPARRAIETLERYRPDAQTVARWQDRSRGEAVSDSLRKDWSKVLGVDLPDIRIHRDEYAELVAEAHRADALTIGSDIFVGATGRSAGVLEHELVHVAQSMTPGPTASRAELEAEATAVQQRQVSRPVHLSASPGTALAHPALRVLLRAGAWLARRTINTVSRHIARHGRRIAGRAVHTIFRNPRQIRTLLRSTVNEAIPILRRATRHGGDDVIEEGGIRIFRQATRTPGKYRYVVERQMDRVIGTQGERILRVVLDETGRIVTAFPVDRLLSIGGAVAVTALTTHTAEASDRIRARIEAEENQPTDWAGEIIDILNPISGGTLNEGEELMLDIDRIVYQTTNDVINEIEQQEQMTLGMEERAAIAELVRSSLGVGMEQEDHEGGD